jgi:hypothetical protein
MRETRWPEKCRSIKDLSITHYMQTAGESFLISDFLKSINDMKSLDVLRMNDVALCPSTSDLSQWPPVDLTEFQASNIHDFEPIGQLLHVVGHSADITIARCAIGDPGPFNATGELTLKDIDASEDLAPLLCSWERYKLTIINCPGFSDDTLHVMSSVVGRCGDYISARYAYTLSIIDCPKFSITALKSFVSFKMKHRPFSVELEKITFSGHVPMISSEDRSWFAQHLIEFSHNR